MGGQTSFEQSFNRSNQMGPSNNPPGVNNHMMYSQQQQQQHQRQQQQQMHQFMNRMSSSDNDYGMFPEHMKGVPNPYGPHQGLAKMGMPGGNNPGLPGAVPGMSLQQQRQQQQQQQFSYSQRMFGGFGAEPEQKKKRGRPRKNETREPGTKRQYKRKPKTQPGELTPQQQQQAMVGMGPGMGQPPVGARIPGAGMPGVGMPGVGMPGAGMPGNPGIRPQQPPQMGSNVCTTLKMKRAVKTLVQSCQEEALKDLFLTPNSRSIPLGQALMMNCQDLANLTRVG